MGYRCVAIVATASLLLGRGTVEGQEPTNTARDGTFRNLRVVVTAPQGRPLVVRSRRGYVAGTTEVPR
jgi:hypothetical protein